MWGKNSTRVCQFVPSFRLKMQKRGSIKGYNTKSLSEIQSNFVVYLFLLYFRSQNPPFGGSSPPHSLQICSAAYEVCFFVAYLFLHRIPHKFAPRARQIACFCCICLFSLRFCFPKIYFWWTVSVAFVTNLPRAPILLLAFIAFLFPQNPPFGGPSPWHS